MKARFLRSAALFVVCCLSTTSLASGQAAGPDVHVPDIPNVANHGSVGTIAAYSIATSACNIGSQPLNWVGWTDQHPVITQNLYRLMDDRFQQIGLSWVVHGFAAQNGSLCTGCQLASSTALGPGCSDAMTAALNGHQINMGPRSEVDPVTGLFPFPPILAGPFPQAIDRRLQADHADLDPALNPGATYYVESQYVAADDHAAGNSANNASYREVTVAANGSTFDLTGTGLTVKNLSAINAWAASDPSVIIENVDVPGDGRFTVAFKAVNLVTGWTRYEYAIHNLNSDRAAVAVSVGVPAGVGVQFLEFHDVSYHSGEPYAAADWTGVIGANGVRWSTTDHATDPNANALRWGSLYNFSFQSSVAPGVVTIELFKPGTPAMVTATAMAQCPPAPTPQGVYAYSVTPNPAYDFAPIVPISFSPPNLAGGMAATINIGFDFPFYDTLLNQIQISPRGYLSPPGEVGDEMTNQLLPDLAQPNGVIAGYWDDLDPAQGGTVRYANLGAAPDRRFIVEFWNVPHAADISQTESFQISLYESGKITISFIASSQGGSGATIGLEHPDADTGVTLSYNMPGLAVPNTSVEFNRVLLGNTTAELLVTGDGTAGTLMGVQLLSSPQSPFVLMGDLDRGPTYLGAAWPPLDLGFSPAFQMFLDGPGVFGPANLLAHTDACGLFSLFFTSQLPSGFEYTVQSVVIEQISPVLLLHVSNSHRIVVP